MIAIVINKLNFLFFNLMFSIKNVEFFYIKFKTNSKWKFRIIRGIHIIYLMIS